MRSLALILGLLAVLSACSSGASQSEANSHWSHEPPSNSSNNAGGGGGGGY
jgi:hypothetical protein